MKIRRFQKRPSLYSTILISITLCIVITLLASSYILYVNYSRIGFKQTFQSDVDSLSQTSKQIVTLRDSAQSLSFQIYQNSNIAKLMYYEKPHIFDVTGAMTELSNYLNSMPFVESIIVYNAKDEVFYIQGNHGQNGIYSKNELTDTGLLTILNDFQQYKPFTPIPRTYAIDDASQDHVNVYTFLCYDAIGRNQVINSAVIVNISSDWINRNQGDLTSLDDKGTNLLLDDRDQVLRTDTLQPLHLSSTDRALLDSKIKNQDTGYVVSKFEGVKSLISYTQPDPLGWQYIRATPYQYVTTNVKTVRNTTIGIAAIILLLGIMLSWRLSRFLYVPIHKILLSLHSLETEKRNNQHTLKQNALHSLLQGLPPSKLEARLHNLSQMGIKFDFHKNYRIAILQIDHFQTLKQEHVQDLPTYKFAIMNISSEILSGVYDVETVDIEDDSIAVLLNFPDEEELADHTAFEALLHRVQLACLNYLKIGLSITYSPVTNLPLHLHPLFQQVKEATKHRLFYGHGCLIDSDDIVALKSKAYMYPLDREKKLVESLMAGKIDEAKKVFSEILDETAQYPIHVVQLAISHLTMTLNNVIFTIQKNGTFEISGGLDIYMPSADSYETLAEIHTAFFTYFDEIQNKLLEKRSLKQEELVRKINSLIALNYADSNLCLNWIADQLDMSSIYISRIYKQQTLAAIIDVINETRLDQARAFLEESNTSIAEIAEKTGYTSSSYFHRMFKKHFGVTPADYRKANFAKQLS
ncbi:hypothetical protein BVG16_19255 [Paenibacillus selenitireducens]|uniref:HTH araC/xylS-type domain-containing protein n=1 Tax=Paenibacillus selenitireducens TaxID=1324314 RepID=A0A1T2X909_9BACL|nr:AraC family transcriptional regulator [Paenibacillus selenitireducens]OPA76330.1 hypothetical protein BVG16_19255 [Paenibacillus selenitireducens]